MTSTSTPTPPPPLPPRPLSGFGKAGLVVAALIAVLSLAGAFSLCMVIVFGAGGERLSGSTGPLMVRLLISCVTIFIAMGFCGVGFGLFVIGAEGNFRVQTQGEPLSSTKGVKLPTSLETSAPGLVVIVCATVIILAGLQIEWSQEGRPRAPALARELKGTEGAAPLGGIRPPSFKEISDGPQKGEPGESRGGVIRPPNSDASGSPDAGTDQ